MGYFKYFNLFLPMRTHQFIISSLNSKNKKYTKNPADSKSTIKEDITIPWSSFIQEIDSPDRIYIPTGWFDSVKEEIKLSNDKNLQ